MKDRWENWFGQLPADFAISRVKNHFDIDPGKMLQGGSAKNSDTSVRYFSVGNVQWGRVDCTTLRDMAASLSDVKRYRIEIGDLLVCEGGEGGRSAVVTSLPSEGTVIYQNHLNRVRPSLEDTGDVLYLRYALEAASSLGLFRALNSGATIKSLSKQKLANIAIPLPTIELQRLIVRYLDNAELRSARAIRAKSKATKLLREARDSMISELVLGDSSSRDSFVNSGIPGIGAVPKHWRLMRAKYVWRAKNIRSKTGDEERLSVSSISGIVPRSSRKVTMFEAASYVGHKVVEPGDLVINSLWAWAAGLGISRHHGIVSPVYGVYELRPEAESDLTYLNYLLRSNAIQWQFQVQSKGIWRSRLQLSDDAFFRIVIPLPPLSEQISIASMISSRIAGLDAAIDAAEHEIMLLREYRTRLIADLVTGQKDVRAEAADLPDVDPLELAQVLSGTITIGDDVDEEVNADAD